MYIYSDITEVGVRVWSDGPRVCFGATGPVLATPSQLMFIRALDAGPTMACGKSQIGDRTILCNALGLQRDIGANHGNHAHGLFAAGPGRVGVAWVDSPTIWKSAVFDAESLYQVEAAIATPMADTWSEGFSDYFPTDPPDPTTGRAEPRWTHLNRIQVLAGVRFFYPNRRGDWTVGQHDDLFVVVHHHPTGKNYLAWPGRTVVQPHINSSGQVAVSAEGDIDALFINPAQFKPYVEDVKPLGRKAIGVIYGSSERYGYGSFPGNCEVLFGSDPPYGPSDWSKMKPLSRPVIAGVDAIVPWPMRLGTWHDTRSSVYPFQGPHPHFVYDEATGERHDGRGDVLLIQCYPRFGETVEAFERRMVAGLNLHLKRQKLIVAKYYPGNPPERFSEEQLLPYLPVYERLVRRDDVQGLLAFDALRSGLAYHPAWLAAFSDLAAASQGLPEFSTVQPSSPVPRARPLRRTL